MMAYKPYVSYEERKKQENKRKSVRGALMRMTLLGTFGAAVGTPVYHEYLSVTEIDAKVTSIETVTPEKQGDKSFTRIHTDKGVFNNQSSWAHLKFQNGVSDIAGKVKVGQSFRFKVYGAHPALGGLSPDVFGFYRNTLSVGDVPVKVEPAPAPVQPKPAVPAAAVPATPPALPAGEALLDVNINVPQDPNAVKACEDNTNIDSLKTAMPQVYRDMAVLQRLPITGKAVFDMVKSADSELRTCLVPDGNLGGTTAGEYRNHHLNITYGDGTGTSAHEMFHAYQDINNHLSDATFKLVGLDAAVVNALEEATAAGYELVVAKEAENRGVPVAKRVSVDGVVKMGAADRPEAKAAFNNAYKRIFDQNANLDAAAREKAALQAGGRAVVLALMLGDDGDWLSGYARQAVNNTNANAQVYSQNSASAAGYVDSLRNAFSLAGKVTDTFNLVPDEFTGQNAQRYAARCKRVMGLQETSQPRSNRLTQAVTKRSPGF